MRVMVSNHPELLRKSAENTLMDMVQLLFTRLPQFKEDPKWNANMRKVRTCHCLMHYPSGNMERTGPQCHHDCRQLWTPL